MDDVVATAAAAASMASTQDELALQMNYTFRNGVVDINIHP